MYGYTYRFLRASGLVTLLALNEDLYLLTGDRDINLDDQQTEAIRRVQTMELSEDEGTVTILHGGYGSGKTIVGIGKAKVYAARREQQGKSVKVLFVGGNKSNLLRMSLEQKHFDIEMEDIMMMCGWGSLDIEEINRDLSHQYDHTVVIYDELPLQKDYSQLKATKGVDMIMIAPYRPDKPIVKLPTQSKFVNCFRLEKSYRQSRQCLDFFNYLGKHLDKHRWNIDPLNIYDEERCPRGFSPVWFHCTEDYDKIRQFSVLQRIKEELDKEGLGGPGVILLDTSTPPAYFKDPIVFCNRYQWRFGGTYCCNGCEADVCMIS